jgi:hypothetical protein
MEAPAVLQDQPMELLAARAEQIQMPVEVDKLRARLPMSPVGAVEAGPTIIRQLRPGGLEVALQLAVGLAPLSSMTTTWPTSILAVDPVVEAAELILLLEQI